MYSTICIAQPFKSDTELLFKADDIGAYFEGKKEKIKISAAVARTHISVVQITGVFKLKDDKGKLGAQALAYLNDEVWIAAETISDLSFDAEHEILVGADIPWGQFSLMPYIGSYIDSETFAAIGLKIYHKNLISLGIEYHVDPMVPSQGNFNVMLGVAIVDGLFKSIEYLFVPKKVEEVFEEDETETLEDAIESTI